MAHFGSRFEELLCSEREYYEAYEHQHAERSAGVVALRRLLGVAQHGHGRAARVAASLLLALYDGGRFAFDLGELRRLDAALFDDCLAVLRLDHQPERELHEYLDDGAILFEQLARDRRLTG